MLQSVQQRVMGYYFTARHSLIHDYCSLLPLTTYHSLLTTHYDMQTEGAVCHRVGGRSEHRMGCVHSVHQDMRGSIAHTIIPWCECLGAMGLRRCCMR